MSEFPRTVTGVPSAGACPDAELLLAFLTAAVDSETARRLDAHLDECDPCLDIIINARDRLSRDSEISVPVPAEVSDRLAAVPPQRAARSAGDRSVATPAHRRVRRLPIPPTVRYALPFALAASLLLVVASQRSWLGSDSGRLTRAVDTSKQVKVTARQVPVRKQPQLQAEVVATLSRGDVVEVGGQDREWYRVTLPGGGEGWIEQEAFR